MDAFLSALIAVLLAETGGRPQSVFLEQWQAEPGRRLATFAVYVLLSVAGSAAAILPGYGLAPLLTREAASLLLAIALALAGVSHLLQPRAAARTTPSAAPTIGRHVLARATDSSLLLMVALGCWTGSAPGAALGGALAMVAAAAIPAVAEAEARTLATLRAVAAGLLLAAAPLLAIAAFRLI